MKTAMVVAGLAVLGLFAASGLGGCSGEEGAPLVSSAYAAPISDPLYPPLQADAADGQVYEYY